MCRRIGIQVVETGEKPAYQYLFPLLFLRFNPELWGGPHGVSGVSGALTSAFLCEAFGKGRAL